MKPLSSRERLLATIRCQEPDYVPLLLHPFGFRPWWTADWSDWDQVVQAKAWLEMGLDAWLGVEPPMTFHPDVTVRWRTERRAQDRWPCMINEYETPAGTLRQEVFLTDDWISSDWPEHRGVAPCISLLDDYNVPRYRACMIQDEQDVEKLKYLLTPMTDKQATHLREQTAAVAAEARRLGVLLRATASSGTDAAVWLCGVEPLVNMAIDRPDLFDALLDIIHRREKRNVEVLLDTPVDLIMRRGYYEGTSFWSPSIYRHFFQPRIKELTNLVHQGGRLMGYTMSVGFMPLHHELLEIGYDMHFLLDPLEPGGGPADLPKLKAAWNGRISVFGGINQHITLQRGSVEDVRREVFSTVRTLGPGGGLCLVPVEAIHSFTPRRSLEAVLDAWKEIRRYPLGA